MYRLRKIWPEYQGRVRVAFRSLALELKNQRSTPKPVLDVEIPLMLEQELDLPIEPWFAPLWKYVPTLLPSGKQIGNPGAVRVKWGPEHQVLEKAPADCPDGDCLQVFRNMLDDAISETP